MIDLEFMKQLLCALNHDACNQPPVEKGEKSTEPPSNFPKSILLMIHIILDDKNNTKSICYYMQRLNAEFHTLLILVDRSVKRTPLYQSVRFHGRESRRNIKHSIEESFK